MEDVGVIRELADLDERFPKDRIRDAVQAGFLAIVPAKLVDFEGGQAVGYVLLDPNTGNGSYVLDQANGGGTKLTCKPVSEIGLAAHRECLNKLALADFIEETLFEFSAALLFLLAAIDLLLFLLVAVKLLLFLSPPLHFPHNAAVESENGAGKRR